VTDPTDDIPLLEWAHKYDAYKRISSDSDMILEVLRPLREALDRDGQIPEWAGVDLLRTWAFAIARQYHWSGGYVPLHEAHPELRLIVDAVNRHPAAKARDRFVPVHPDHARGD
jgi:hypothetical protein